MAGITKDEVDKLQAEVARLTQELAGEKIARTQAEELAMAVSQAGPFFSSSEEQPTGKTISVEKCANPWEKDEKKQKFVTVDVPTYFYTIQLPTGAGWALMTNGVAYYHGETYEFDQDGLADIKSRVARTWDHEKSIHGDNENSYRKPTNKHLISAAAAKRGVH